MPPTNVERFISEEAKERFEVLRSFEVVGERKFDVTRLTKYPIFDTMIRERGWEELNGMVRDTNNKSVIMEFFANARFSEVRYKAYIRGKTIDYSPDAINRLLGLTAPEECEVQRLERERKDMAEQDWDDLIAKMCRPEATWKSARMLTYAEFLPIPKAWASFVIQTLESTSCSSEIPLKRVFTVSTILDQKAINVGELIANNIHGIATGKKTVLGHGTIINWLCEKQMVQEFEGDLYTATIQPITDKTIDVFMKKYQEFTRERERRDAPEMPHQQQQAQMEQGEGSQHGSYPPIHPMMLEYMFTSANWMNETSDQMWVNRPRFSAEFAAEAQMHRRPITGSFERFDSSRTRMDEYFAHQEQYAAHMRKEITDDFDAGEKRAADEFFEGLPEADDVEDINMD